MLLHYTPQIRHLGSLNKQVHAVSSVLCAAGLFINNSVFMDVLTFGPESMETVRRSSSKNARRKLYKTLLNLLIIIIIIVIYAV